jgi:hypothetical protein
VADSLAPHYVLAPSKTTGAVRLRDPRGTLPDIGLQLHREARIFSRTMSLVITSSLTGEGPMADGTATLRKGRLLLRSRLQWQPPSEEGAAWCRRFEEAGLLGGVAAMTSVQHLAIGWTVASRRWDLWLETLAGALIGTSPATTVAVPMEPEDVEGLLIILQSATKTVRSESA